MKNAQFVELLSRISAVFAPTGCENRAIGLLKDELEGVCACSVDRFGDLICHLPGDGPTTALISGVDEAGFMISKIDDKGYVRVETTGNGDSACFLGKKMLVGNETQLFEGFGAGKVLHALKGNEGSEAPAFDRVFIDLGFEKKEDWENKIEVGDFAAYKGEFFELPNGYLVGKALETRANCALLVELLKETAKKPHKDLYVIFAVKEKIGFSGAVTALQRISPDRAVVLGFEPSKDLNEKDEDKKGARLGAGAVLTLKDGRALYYDSSFFEEAKKLQAEAPVQVLDGRLSLSSARAHESLAGIPMISLRLPCHNPETPYVIVHERDLESLISILRKLV